MKKNKVSIVVPVYNVPEKYLVKCVNSLKNQTLKEIEIILVDDGTFETSGKICDKLAKDDYRIKVIHQDNKGLCGARNSGLKKATGEWIAFVDGDDWIEENTYEVMYKKCIDNDVDVGAFGYVKDYPSYSVESHLEQFFVPDKVYSKKEELKYLKKMVLNYNATFSSVVTKLIKRSFLLRNNLLLDESLRQGAEGIEYNTRLINCANRVVIINQNFYHYIFNNDSITNVHNEKNHEMVLECFKKIKKEIDLDDDEIKKMFYNRMKYVVITTAISGYFSSSNKVNFFKQKKGFKNYLKNNLVIETLKNKDDKGLNKNRKITLWLIRLKFFLLVKVIAKIRSNQKK